MTRLKMWIGAGLIAAGLINLSLPAAAQLLTCRSSAGVAPVLRAEGFTEIIGDLVLSCTGGTPTAPGQPVPQIDISIFLNANITSKILSTHPAAAASSATGALNEALLLVDEPNSPNSLGVQCGPGGQICAGGLPGPPAIPSTSGQPYPMLNCGAVVGGFPAAPDGGPSKAGICGIVAPTGPGGKPAPEHTYDGTVAGGNYWTPPAGQSAYHDPCGSNPSLVQGAVGAPGYQCGRPNAFQGRVGTVLNPTQDNAVTFLDVPFDPPGTSITRTLRFTNIRVNANALGVSDTFTNFVLAAISISGTNTLAIQQVVQIVGFISPGNSTAGCQDPAALTVRLCEGFASSWKTKNISFTAGTFGGLAGNAAFNSPGCANLWCYDGGTNYPADDAQNVPGFVYNTESGMEWPNNGANGPPSPNPPSGFGFNGTVPNQGNPFSDDWTGTPNATGIAGAGVADAGTRFEIRFTHVPAGASVQVPKVVQLLAQGSVSNPTGVMVLTDATNAGSGSFSPAASGTVPASGRAVYEVLYAGASTLEYADIPYTVTGGSAATVKVRTMFAARESGAAAGEPSATLPVPRFSRKVNDCGSCTTVTPATGGNTGPVTVQIAGIVAGLLEVGPGSLTLSAAGVPDIPATNVLCCAQATFDLTGAAPGARGLAFNGTVVAPDAFTILKGQTIAFAALASRVFGSAPFAVHATSSAGLNVSFNSQTSAVCHVAGDTVTLVAAGTCTIQATQAGNATIGAATPVNQSFQVTQAAQTITFAALPNRHLTAGAFAVHATASSGLGVGFNSQTTAVCKVSGDTVTLLTTGMCTVQAAQAGNTDYAAAAPVDRSFQVN